MKKMALLSMFLALPLGGCLSTNITQLAQALAKDQASVCVNITSVYGTLRVARTNLVSGTVTCNSDGLTVSPQQTLVNVQPQVMNVQPQMMSPVPQVFDRPVTK